VSGHAGELGETDHSDDDEANVEGKDERLFVTITLGRPAR
jgi:hypothetical protein